MWQLGVVYTQQQEQRWSRMIKFSSGETGDCLRWFKFTNQPLLYAVACWDLEARIQKLHQSQLHQAVQQANRNPELVYVSKQHEISKWLKCCCLFLGVNSNWVLSACDATVSIVKCCLILSVILSSRMQAALQHLQQQKGLRSNLLYLDV